jgi:translation initiation factor 2B subunit (eIF-2B alpha/beta/delta family)
MTPTIETVVKMLEQLSEAKQAQVVEHLREYLSELDDEARWDESFARTQSSLVAAARRAKAEILQGLSKPLDVDDL